MGNDKRRRYDSEFKKNAVPLTIEFGKAVREVADNLGINKDLIWSNLRKG